MVSIGSHEPSGLTGAYIWPAGTRAVSEPSVATCPGRNSSVRKVTVGTIAREEELIGGMKEN